MKEEIKEEIRQLVVGEGELYDQLAQAAEDEFEDELQRADALDAVVAEGIAQRASFMASYCTATPNHNMPPFIIMGTWANAIMEVHLAHVAMERMNNLFGMGKN
jgi:hypothetical protein